MLLPPPLLPLSHVYPHVYPWFGVSVRCGGGENVDRTGPNGAPVESAGVAETERRGNPGVWLGDSPEESPGVNPGGNAADVAGAGAGAPHMHESAVFRVAGVTFAPPCVVTGGRNAVRTSVGSIPRSASCPASISKHAIRRCSISRDRASVFRRRTIRCCVFMFSTFSASVSSSRHLYTAFLSCSLFTARVRRIFALDAEGGGDAGGGTDVGGGTAHTGAGAGVAAASLSGVWTGSMCSAAGDSAPGTSCASVGAVGGRVDDGDSAVGEDDSGASNCEGTGGTKLAPVEGEDETIAPRDDVPMDNGILYAWSQGGALHSASFVGG